MGQEILYLIGAIVLFGVLIWGTMQYRSRSRAETKVGEDVVRERYKRNEG